MRCEQVIFIPPSDGSRNNPLVAAITTRLGGISQPPYDSLNLGKSTSDDPVHVAHNWSIVCRVLGIDKSQISTSNQVHGSEIAVVSEPCHLHGYDGMITATPGVFLAVSVADCVPVLVWDPVSKVCGAFHAGWRGTVAGVVPAGIQLLVSRFGSNPGDLRAWIGPSICARTFEVGSEVAEQFEARYVRKGPAENKYMVDLKHCLADQLLDMGLSPAHLQVSRLSTVLHNHLFFSHRKAKGLTGRQQAIIGWR